MREILRERRVQVALVLFVLIGVLPITLKGLQFGMDFAGGSVIDVKLDRTLTADEMQNVVAILQNRLNAYGLKDVAVRPSFQQYITIEIAETNPEAINQLQSLLGQQGKFETLFNGQVILSGTDIVSVITDPQKGYGVRSGGAGDYMWVVPFLLSSDGSQKFAQSVEGQCTQIQGQDSCAEVVYMFIDRPENAVILMPSSVYEAEKAIPSDLENADTTIAIDDLVKNSGVELVVSDTIDADVLAKIANKTVVIPKDVYNVSLLANNSARVLVKEKTGGWWIVSALNLENIIHLTPGVTSGNPVTEPSITGHADSPQKAMQEMNRVVILLKSGKLPVSVSVGSVSTISPVLGAQFLQYSAVAGLAALLSVTAVLFIRYRKVRVAVPILLTGIFEVTMVVGFAALISWQLDLPSIAGIIATIGTGVNDQIIIIEEMLRKEHGVEIESSTANRIKKAFSIIVMAASTIILAMSPLLFMGLGVLKGFAITTIAGALIGLLITRPAYAAIVGKLTH